MKHEFGITLESNLFSNSDDHQARACFGVSIVTKCAVVGKLTGADLGGGCRGTGGAAHPPPPSRDDLRLSDITGSLFFKITSSVS